MFSTERGEEASTSSEHPKKSEILREPIGTVRERGAHVQRLKLRQPLCRQAPAKVFNPIYPYSWLIVETLACTHCTVVEFAGILRH